MVCGSGADKISQITAGAGRERDKKFQPAQNSNSYDIPEKLSKISASTFSFWLSEFFNK